MKKSQINLNQLSPRSPWKKEEIRSITTILNTITYVIYIQVYFLFHLIIFKNSQ